MNAGAVVDADETVSGLIELRFVASHGFVKGMRRRLMREGPERVGCDKSGGGTALGEKLAPAPSVDGVAVQAGCCAEKTGSD